MTPINKAKAWGVHAVTASGVILALLALLALVDNKPQACLLWLGLALLVDGLDGTLARKYEVKEMLPHFDGSVLDLVIDYLTYVFIPAIFIYRYIPPAGAFRAAGGGRDPGFIAVLLLQRQHEEHR
ncbi:Phosphatidylcholine synthase [Pseudomonas aeruginosa]|nr:Phosphatidylcholine synthase [Pseudomonas aeruginosa]